MHESINLPNSKSMKMPLNLEKELLFVSYDVYCTMAGQD